MILGITGGTGCGKTTVLEVIRELGGTVLDCDAIYHRLLERSPQLLEDIENRFPGVVTEGKLDRKKLGERVFSDPNALLDLNRIAHGAVKQEVLRLLAPKPELAAIDAIALFEGGLAELCDYTIAVTAPKEARLLRLMARDGITEEYALARINAQKTAEQFREMTDFSLENDGTQAEFESKTKVLLQQLLGNK